MQFEDWGSSDTSAREMGATLYPVTEYTRADWQGGMLARLQTPRRAPFIAPIALLAVVAAGAVLKFNVGV